MTTMQSSLLYSRSGIGRFVDGCALSLLLWMASGLAMALAVNDTVVELAAPFGTPEVGKGTIRLADY